MKEFIQYLIDFYGEHGVYPYGFTQEEIISAISVRQKMEFPFYGDSMDREIVRDIVFRQRDPEAVTEYQV